MKRIYLDYAATTPVDKSVVEAMEPYFREKFGNPGSLHSFGQEAIAALDLSREAIAKAIGAGFMEVVFTGSATEANNLALRGAIKSYQHKSAKISINQRPRLIISAIEHESVLETARDLEQEGIEVIYLPVSREGVVDLKKLESSLNERTVLVSIMYANNEIGVIQPISEISKVIRDFREEREKKTVHFPLFHVDAVQAFQYLDCDVKKLGVDLMTFSAHKMYGPKGIGALYIANRIQPLATRVKKSTLYPKPYTLNPIITGGGQEFGLRSGTENVPGVVGFAKAVELVASSRELENGRIRKLRDYFWQELKKSYPQIKTNPDKLSALIRQNQHKSAFLPNILNVYFPDHLSQDLLIKLDVAGVAVSSGSACRARSTKPSHVLETLGLSPEHIKHSIRFSLGRFTTKEEIDETIRRLKNILV